MSYCFGFLGADWWGSDARAMAAEFRGRDHVVLERHYEDYFPSYWRTPALKAARRLLRGAITREYNRAVVELLQVPSLDFLLVFKGMLLEPGTLARFKQRNIPCYCFYPDVSFEDHGSNIVKCLPLYDCVFTSKRFHLEDPTLRKRGPTNWIYAPHGFDPEVHRPVRIDGRSGSLYRADLSFVGNWSRKKEGILGGLLAALPELELKIWGPGWDRAAQTVRARWQGRGAYGDELAAIYSLSAINLGLLSEAGRGAASGDLTTARTWQIPGAGGFLLHEDTPEMRDAFVAGQEVILFDSPESLASAVKQFLGDEPARQRIARSGRNRALASGYTYAPAVDLILNYHARPRR